MPATAMEVRYNVECMNCGAVFTPPIQSPLWWRAKARGDDGYLDALHVSGVECGCVEKKILPNAPYRVFGYNDMCEDFDMSFKTSTAAVREYLKIRRVGRCIVFISGVSKTVMTWIKRVCNERA